MRPGCVQWCAVGHVPTAVTRTRETREPAGLVDGLVSTTWCLIQCLVRESAHALKLAHHLDGKDNNLL